MEAYQQRVVEERAALDEKVGKLTAFVETERFRALPEAEQARMTRQLEVMREYSQILGERIEGWLHKYTRGPANNVYVYG